MYQKRHPRVFSPFCFCVFIQISNETADIRLEKKKKSSLREGKEKNSRLGFHSFSHDSLECQNKVEVLCIRSMSI